MVPDLITRGLFYRNSMERQRLTYLLEQYTGDVATPDEIGELQQFIDKDENKELFTDLFTDFLLHHKNASFDASSFADLSKKVLQIDKGTALSRNQSSTHRIHFLKTSWFRYAAAIVLILGGAAIWYIISQNNSARHFERSDSVVRNLPDIQPGGNRAILTIGNQSINLASNKTGIAVGSVITYNDGKRIADAGQQLMLTTPRGGQYQAVLPDGSKVWLNAASSIKFPSKFTGNKREVEVTGEVYLEVAKNSKQPFYVHTRETDIQVLGTNFNVEAYENEKMVTTTLLEGTIRIIKGEERLELQPGQQAITVPRINFIKFVPQANIDEVTAWRSGLFNFNNAGVATVMRQLERWYDINVIYKTTIPDIEFAGEMSRNTNLSGVLKILKDAGLNYKLEGKTLIIL